MSHQFLYKRRKAFAVLVSISFIITSLIIPVHADNSVQKSVSNVPPGIHSTDSSGKSIIVKYRDDKKSSFVKQAVSKKLNNYKINIKRNLGNIDIIDTSDEAEYQMVLHELKNSPYVEYAQPDYKLKKFEIDTEDLSSKQWGISNSGQTIAGQAGNSGVDINVRPVWDYTKGNESVIVGVLDTGIDISHPELKDSIYINQKEIPGNGKDDDQNGYIDDVNGWDFMNSDNTVYDNSEEDFHGTHVAGIIAGKHDNQGINGIAPNVKILPLKFLNLYNGFTSDAIEAIRYAKSMGVKVINCSFGDTNYNYALENEMRESGILYVCASGNDGANLDTDPAYPVSFNIPNMITVAAVNNKGELCDFSNYGSAVDVAAPGENIISTIPGGKFDYASGTSMSAPFVTGTAALLLSFNPSYSFSKVKEEIKRTVNKLDTLNGKVETGGMVNAFKASLSSILPYNDKVLTKKTDKIDTKNLSSGYLSGYSFNDMVPLSDGWVIIGDVLKKKILIINVFSGEISKEYQLNVSPSILDFNPEKGKIIATKMSSTNITLIDIYTDEIKYIPILGSSVDIAFAKNNYAVVLTEIGTSSFDKKISILDCENGFEVAFYSTSSENLRYLACDRSTNNILVGEGGDYSSSLCRYVFNEYTKVLENKEYISDAGFRGRELAISPDGLHAAFACYGGNNGDGTVSDIDATNIKNKLGEWNVYSIPTSVAFSGDSKYIIVTTNGWTIELYDVIGHKYVDTIANKGYASGFLKVGISNGGKIAFAKGDDGRLYYYLTKLTSTAAAPPTETPTSILTPPPTTTSDEAPTLTTLPISTPTPETILNTGIPELTRMSDNIDTNRFSSGYINGYICSDMYPLADGWVIIGDYAKNKVLIINVLTGAVKKEYQLNAPPGKIVFNPEKGKIIATQGLSNNIALIDLYTDEIKYIPNSSNYQEVIFANNNYAVALVATGTSWYDKNKLSVLDWENGLEVASRSNQNSNYNSLVCDRATNNILVSVSDSNSSWLSRIAFDEGTKKLEPKESCSNFESGGKVMAISPDGLHVAFSCKVKSADAYTIFDVNATNINNNLGEWNIDDYPMSASFSKDNKYIIIASISSIKVFSVTTHKLVKTIALAGYMSGFRKIGISNGGKIVYAIGGNGELHYYLITDDSIVSTPAVLNNTIKGTIHLPGNLTADDIHIEVYLQNPKGKVYSTPIVIKKGTNSQDYTLLSPSASPSDKFQIGYCISDGGQSYAKSGIYSSAGTVFDEDYAENLKIAGNLNGIDMELLVKRAISGKVSLPAGDIAPRGGVEVMLSAGYNDTTYYTEYVTIPEGQNSSNFKILAYANDSHNKYTLRYSLEDIYGYLGYGYYNSSGTSTKLLGAAPIDISHNNVSNIQIALLKGRTISGTIKLPDNGTAPEGGIQVVVVAGTKDKNTYYTRMAKIEGGKTSVSYSITVPDSNNSYYVSYYSVYTGYVRTGYYQSGNTVANPDNANTISVYGKYVPGINLTLIPGKVFKGSVLLHGTSVAPKGGIRVTITAKGSKEVQPVSTGITIKEDCNSADYAITVPLSDAGYAITYSTEEKGYLKDGYSNIDSGTTVYYSQATIYPASANDEQIVNMQLIAGTDITGEISLTSGTAPSEGTMVYIFLAGGSGLAALKTVLIPAGSSKAAYTITAPRYMTVYLGYILSSDESFGYYSNGQTVYDKGFAESIYVGNETITGKNMAVKFQPPTQPPIQPPINNGGVPYIPLPEVSGATPTTASATKTTPTPTVTPAATLSPDAKPTKEAPVDNKPSAKAYKDITGHWAEQYVNTLQGLGVISGYEDNTIRPNKEISRAEAVVIICRAVGLKPAETFKLNFSDNNYIPNWAIGYVQTIVDKGILKGYPDNTFKPNAKITRAEVIALVINAFGLSGSPKAYHIFSDDKAIAPWAKNYIQNAFELGIVNGYKDNSIKPGNNISRAEMFVITAKCLDIKK